MELSFGRYLFGLSLYPMVSFSGLYVDSQLRRSGHITTFIRIYWVDDDL